MENSAVAVHTATDGGPGDVSVQVTKTVTAPASPDSPVTKIVVAVHGIGDQHTFATIQSVVNQFCSFYGQPAGVPLGNFHNGRRTFSLASPYPCDPFERFAFAEVYWAKIPRTAVDDKHTLEESKKWARTIVERMRLRWTVKQRRGGVVDGDFKLVKQVLSEMIQTVAVLDRVCYLAERAGLFTFDLRQLLEDYLGDVQVVTEFDDNRNKILDAFREVLADAHASSPKAEIYIVAHSEGTVVALLGLLRAFREETRPEWANHVRGLMTLGSPIDKHLLLWPELFGEGKPAQVPDRPIEWRNYYDFGDPIGFALDDARAWIGVHGWGGVFNFTADHDHGFTRYLFPGKAHVDYWADSAVFGHFLTTVMEERPNPADHTPAAVDYTSPPADRRHHKWLTYVLPYLGVGVLLGVGAYIMFKAVAEVITPDGQAGPGVWEIFSTVARNTVVLFGITVAARVPRLTRHWGVRALSLAVAALACAVYYFTAPADAPRIEALGLSLPSGVTTVILASIVIVLASVLASIVPSWGVVPLMLAGAIGVTAKIAPYLINARSASDIGPVWPVFIATAVFLYLWWLAALIFDLVVFWHWYIRNAQIMTRMDEMLGGRRDGRKNKRPRGTPDVAGYAPQVQR